MLGKQKLPKYYDYGERLIYYTEVKITFQKYIEEILKRCNSFITLYVSWSVKNGDLAHSPYIHICVRSIFGHVAVRSSLSRTPSPAKLSGFKNKRLSAFPYVYRKTLVPTYQYLMLLVSPILTFWIPVSLVPTSNTKGGGVPTPGISGLLVPKSLKF